MDLKSSRPAGGISITGKKKKKAPKMRKGPDVGKRKSAPKGMWGSIDRDWSGGSGGGFTQPGFRSGPAAGGGSSKPPKYGSGGSSKPPKKGGGFTQPGFRSGPIDERTDTFKKPGAPSPKPAPKPAPKPKPVKPPKKYPKSDGTPWKTTPPKPAGGIPKSDGTPWKTMPPKQYPKSDGTPWKTMPGGKPTDLTSTFKGGRTSPKPVKPGFKDAMEKGFGDRLRRKRKFEKVSEHFKKNK